MSEIILEMPICVTVKFASWNTTDTNVGGFQTALFLFVAPGKADFGGELGDVFVILEVSPKFYLGAGFFV